MNKEILALAEQIRKYALKHNQLAFMKPLNDNLDKLVEEIKHTQNNNCNNCKSLMEDNDISNLYICNKNIAQYQAGDYSSVDLDFYCNKWEQNK